ncbi:TNT domain-containing protein [Listeria sp. FSL L7-1582]|nr:TNT domain-containing protein [Listeria portnoyi]
MLWNGIVESYLEPYKKGDAYGLASSTILFASLFGITKGINDLGKIKKVKVNDLSDEFGAVAKPFTPKKIVLENGEIAYESKGGVLVRSPKYLDESGGIKWPEADGFVVDKAGKAITFDANLKVGQVIDRYGDASGRFISPVENGKILDYDTRGLPYPETNMKYHQYKIMKDINVENLKEGFNKMAQLDKDELTILMDKYEFSFSDMAKAQQGEVSKVFGSGGGTQIKFETSVEWYEKMGLLKEVK